jgi:hypothetical protein
LQGNRRQPIWNRDEKERMGKISSWLGWEKEEVTGNAHLQSQYSLAEVVDTLMDNQVPGLIKGFHDRRLQGPFLSCSQVLLQLLQAGHAQDDGVPEVSLEGETATLQHFFAQWWLQSLAPSTISLLRLGSVLFILACSILAGICFLHIQ